MLRTLGKSCFAAAYTAAYTLTKRASRSRSMPFIICYHRVVQDFEQSARTTIPSMLISESMLERHIDWLSRRFSIVSLDEIGRYLESDRPFSRPSAAITFDDGYADVYHHGFPLLMRKGVPAAVFVVTDLVGTEKPQVFDRLYLLLQLLNSRGVPLAQAIESAMKSSGVETLRLDSAGDDDAPFRLMTLLLNRLPRETVELLISALQEEIRFDRAALKTFAPLSWDMIERMHRSGITIGSHTQSHALLTSERLASVTQQLWDSKAILESKLQDKIRHFAYPDGRFNPAVVEAVNASGYRFAYGICPQRDSRFPLLTIPRKVLWEQACMNPWGTFSSAIMNCHAHGVFDPRNRCDHDHVRSGSGEMNGTIN